MARNFPANTKAQKALEELYEKETLAQLNWFLKCQEAQRQSDSILLTANTINYAQTPNIKNLVKNYKIKNNLPIEDEKKENSNLIENKLLVNFPKFDLDIDKPEMHPPSKNILELLYNGNSKEGKGRYVLI